jgi:hypothetical protein
MSTPTLEDLKLWLGLTDPSDTADDVVLQESLDAASVAQAAVVAYPVDLFGDVAFTSDLRTALFLRAQRLAARRNSPTGIEGLTGTGGDLVAARVPSFDVDVSNLEGPYRKIPVA